MTDEIDALRETVARLTVERDSLVQGHQAEMAEVNKAARQTVLTGALRAEAMRVGAHDPDLILGVVDRSAIGWSDEGIPTGVEAAIAEAKRARRYLFRETAGGKTSAECQTNTPRPASAETQDARRLTDQDYVARKRQFLAGII
ncbi:phage scaffolding protein [Asaia krungthepensis]|uniref:Phage minor structual protein GP20 n=1 Tax=Asaia krungthepensis NRIC 0535 TaxID=1307925 RepID=A0ABQ0Q2K1_9PROT|nr:hypothetical protein [Asaia krungthepensis]GBQ88317.1 hypothetical protein AA0535_1513 [Asaia krungthepensis NRIC 0535]